MVTTVRRKVTQPLEGVTVVFGALLLALVALAAVTTLTGSGSFLGFGHGMICANLAGTYGSGNWTASQFDITALRGASVNVNGTMNIVPTGGGNVAVGGDITPERFHQVAGDVREHTGTHLRHRRLILGDSVVKGEFIGVERRAELAASAGVRGYLLGHRD